MATRRPAAPRTITVTFRDGGGLIATATATVDVQPVDDPPVLDAPARVDAEAGSSAPIGAVTISDPDSASLDVRAELDTGAFAAGHGDFTTTGSAAQVAAALRALR